VYGESPDSFIVFAVPVDMAANAVSLLKAVEAPVIDGIADRAWDNVSLQDVEQFAVRSAPGLEYTQAYWKGLSGLNQFPKVFKFRNNVTCPIMVTGLKSLNWFCCYSISLKILVRVIGLPKYPQIHRPI